MKTAREILNECCSEAYRYPTKGEAIEAMRLYGEEVKEAAAQEVETFIVPLEDAPEMAKKILGQNNVFLKAIAQTVRALDLSGEKGRKE